MGILSKLLSAGNFCTYNRFVAKKIGVESAILLGVLCSFSESCGDGFFCQQSRLAEITSLSRYAIGTATKNLIDCGLVKTELKGIPAQLRYTIDEHSISQFLENEQLVSRPSPSCSISSNINKYNNIVDSSMTKNKTIKDKPTKHKYGSFNNVLLTDDELTKLKERFIDWQDRIESASLYLEAKGDKYKSHYAMILNWDRLAKKRAKEPDRKRPAARDYDYDFT